MSTFLVMESEDTLFECPRCGRFVKDLEDGFLYPVCSRCLRAESSFQEE